MRKYQTLRLLSLATVALLGLFSSQKASAQTYNDWDGSDLSTIAASNISTTATETNTVFLYNVGKKKFLNRGGSWGTEAVLSDVGMEFKVIKTTNYNGSTYYQFNSQMKAEDTTYPYLTFINNDKNTLAFFVDQGGTNFSVSSTKVDGKTCYTMSFSNYGTTYYICGSNNSSSSTASEYSDIAVNAFSSTSNITDNSDKWIFVTVKERKDKFAEANMDAKVEVPATFMMHDNDFARRSTDIKHWLDANGDELSNTNTVTTPSTYTGTYYIGNGVADADATGAKWTANIHGTSGEIKQTLSDLFRHGWYEIRCNAFSTSATSKSAYLYASVGSATKRTKAKSNYTVSYIQTGTTAPSTYIEANDEVNKQTNDVYAYQVVARVYVEETSAGDDSRENCQDLTFGVKVDGGNSGDWLCVDNFEIYYIGEGGNEVVLDETQPDATYMTEQATAKNSTIYLNRSLSANTWNTIVLPFDMSASDITSTFGSGTLLSKYKGAEEGDQNTIHFEKATTIDCGKLYIIKPLYGEPEPNLLATSTTTELTSYSLNEKTGEKTLLSKGEGTLNSDGQLTLKDKYYTIPNIVYGSKDESGNIVEFEADVKDNSAEAVSGGKTYQFTGTYTKQLKVVPVGAYMLKAQNETEHTYSTGTWQYRTKAASSLGFRGWLAPVSDDAKTQSLSFVIDGVEDNTTRIEGITTDKVVRPALTGIYNMNGQLLSSDAQQISTMPKGLYIVNGKRVVVR